MKLTKLLLLAFLLITTVSVQAQFTAVPAAGIQKLPGHYIGEKYGGGIVFYITPDSLHGLVAETQDQSINTWYNAQNLISVRETHSTAGKNFTDWRLPTFYELNILYGERAVVGGFASTSYWSSTEHDFTKDLELNFGAGTLDISAKTDNNNIRAVRAF